MRDPGFWSAAGFTLVFTFVSVPLELALGLAVAQDVHERPAAVGARRWQFDGWQRLRREPGSGEQDRGVQDG